MRRTKALLYLAAGVVGLLALGGFLFIMLGIVPRVHSFTWLDLIQLTLAMTFTAFTGAAALELYDSARAE